MMKVEVKLYSYHDMDLVGLYKTGKVSFPETTRQVLNSYALGEVYKVKLLHTNEKRLAKYPKTSFRKYYHYHVMLDGKDDADAISLLHKITPGYRNNFIKVVLRQYLCGVFLEEYCTNGDTSFFNEMSRKFQGERDEREIKQTKKEKNEYAQIKVDNSEKTHETDFSKTMTKKKQVITGKERLQVKNQSLIDKDATVKVKDKEKEIGLIDSKKDVILRDARHGGYRNTKFKNEATNSFSHDELHSENRNYTQKTKADKPMPEKVSDDFNTEHGFSSENTERFEDDLVSINARPLSRNEPPKTIDISSYDNEDDDFDDFLDEMTEQY